MMIRVYHFLQCFFAVVVLSSKFSYFFMTYASENRCHMMFGAKIIVLLSGSVVFFFFFLVAGIESKF